MEPSHQAAHPCQPEFNICRTARRCYAPHAETVHETTLSILITKSERAVNVPFVEWTYAFML
jgi:hypothetical protein